ncbi:poly(ethylene terephthalate) hydrolase family protein [Motilibacter aurantiacus]|uniref:poly(ethylene terephthalate) hydrolase family protein n=1 Tax=Motilibacter aurantiacus TaxID=2714955 RepID=UPI00140C0B59|nr:hypothetical protein [Motilibacter aurantiacus]NHC46547.1 hypothetical protein [Motilibacter aurantiacus]
MQWTSRARKRAASGALAVGLGIAGVVALPTTFATSVNAAPTLPSDGTWDVTATPTGYKVTLTLDSEVPVRDALTELAVDGRVIGEAKQSLDGKTLTVETTDKSVADATSVQLAFSGSIPSVESAASTAKLRSLRVAPESQSSAVAAAATIADDPATPGAYTVKRADYSLGESVWALPGLFPAAKPVEDKAAVYLPDGAPGARPLVVFLHGRHSACYNATTRGTNNAVWPCPATHPLPIDSYKGYDETAEALASHGYVVVSISANGINSQDANFSDDAGTAARGQLVMKHLDQLARWNDNKGDKAQRAVFAGRIDFDNVGLMGHSRGGEGVVEAALQNAELHKPYNIRAVLPLAPIDFARETLPDVPMAIILPYCDGDVSNQQGQHYYDDSRYANKDDVLRTSLMVLGTDHNFFNTEWTPATSVAPSSDDWGASTDSVCGSAAPNTTRLSPALQRAVGTAYMAGFFRLVQGGENQFLPLFDGTNGTVPSTAGATVYTQAQAPGSQRLDVAPLEAPSSNVIVSGFTTQAYCYNTSNRILQGTNGVPCFTPTQTSRAPHWTSASYAPFVPISPVFKATWTTTGTTPPNASLFASLPAGSFDVSGYAALSFRAAKEETQTGDVDLNVTLIDGSGKTQSTTVASNSSALISFPASTNTTNGVSLTPKTWMQTARLPLSLFNSLDLKDIRQVRITPATLTGGVYLSDIAFDTPGVGAGGPTELPHASLADVTVPEGNAPGYATMRITLDDKLEAPASLWVTSNSTASTAQVDPIAIPVLLPEGSRGTTVQIPLRGNTVASGTATNPLPTTALKVILANGKGVVFSDQFALLNIVEDDPRPAS